MICQIIKTYLRSVRNLTRNGIMRHKYLKKYPSLSLSGDIYIKNVVFGKYNLIQQAYIINSKMGDYSYVAKGVYVNNADIGKFTCIGPNVQIGLGEHPTKEFISIHPVFYSLEAQLGFTYSEKKYFNELESTKIGNDVWIGVNAIIKGGISIGDGAIIAAGAIVTKDVEPYAIVGGVPARLLKYRFPEDEIKSLLDLKWWNYEEKWLKKNAHLFTSVRNLKNLQESD